MIFNNNIDQVIVRISSLPSEDHKVPQIVQTLPGSTFFGKNPLQPKISPFTLVMTPFYYKK